MSQSWTVSSELVMGVSPTDRWWVYFMDNPSISMDDDWSYPYFRKPPYAHHGAGTFSDINLPEQIHPVLLEALIYQHQSKHLGMFRM